MVYLNHKVCFYFIMILYFFAITITDRNSIAFYCKQFTINASKGFLFCYNWRIINIMQPPFQITKNNAFYGEVFTPSSFLNSLFLFSYLSFEIKDAQVSGVAAANFVIIYPPISTFISPITVSVLFNGNGLFLLLSLQFDVSYFSLTSIAMSL